MKHRAQKDGFTLIEVLLAMTIVVSIVSMVYGSYFATAKSAEVYKARMTMSESAGGVLQQMARQIRCSYARAAEASAASAEKPLPKKQGILDKPVNYFKGGHGEASGKILHFITTARFSRFDDFKDGLLDVAYKFDRSTRTLLVGQRRFVETTDLAEDREFMPAVEGVEYVGLTFLDARKWLDEWDFSQKKKLPRAVRISIVCEDENGRKCTYSTIAYVHCLRNLNNENATR